MKYYLCTKEKSTTRETNWFITYTFYSNYTDSQTHNQFAYGNEFTLGQIYTNRDKEDDVVYDNNGIVHKLENVREFLEAFDFVIDEEVNKIVERKGDRFHVNITPLSKRDGNVNYLITCRYTHTDGVAHYTQNINKSQYDGVIFGLKMMRKSDRITNLWRDVVRYHKIEIRRKK